MQGKFLLVAVLLALTNVSVPQKLRNFETVSSLQSNIENLPFQIGIDIGFGLPLNEFDNYGKYGFSGYIDINIYKRIWFLQMEFGRAKLNRIEKTSTYGSVGFALNTLKFNRSRVVIQAGLCGYSNLKLFSPLPIVTIRYLYVLHKLIGLTTSVKIFFGGSFNPYLTFGMQFYTN